MTRSTPPTLPLPKSGQRDKYAWPGGYPIYYIVADMEPLCADCANGKNGSRAAEKELDTKDRNDDQWRIVAAEINWEDPDLICGHCNARIESAYAEPAETDDDADRIVAESIAEDIAQDTHEGITSPDRDDD